MPELTIFDFAGLLRVIWPLEGPHSITHEEALLRLSNWQCYHAEHRYFYPDSSPFFAACNAAGLFNKIPVSGARRFVLYQLNTRGQQFHTRLGALLARRMAAQRNDERCARTAVLRAMQDGIADDDCRAERSAQRYG